jgi:hypothetical protein
MVYPQVYAGKASLLHWTHMVYKLVQNLRKKNVSITMASDLIKYRSEAHLKATFQVTLTNRTTFGNVTTCWYSKSANQLFY